MTRFVKAYIAAALWSSVDDNEEPFDRNYSEDDIAPETLAKMEKECEEFQTANKELLEQAEALATKIEWTYEEQAGHDLWLTRNRHGAGFWDRGLGTVGDKLTEAAHAMGEVYLFAQDGLVYCE